MVSLNSQKKKNISKMEKFRNHSQLKKQENSPEATNNETDLCSLIDTDFKRAMVKILKELRVNMKELREYIIYKITGSSRRGAVVNESD